ncbi:uncharacterized protein ARMOST_15642 [Armillaria ostoyae]|uniref:Uncharacterized protein n=1 Tax=Armillaria ostoyae TaxID=47428 RepID=A0A284RU26_ARMOS|nr:uncharacterized protein ARMOST_15642 [Armillaria ostoyae]
MFSDDSEPDIVHIIRLYPSLMMADPPSVPQFDQPQPSSSDTYESDKPLGV